MANLGAVTESSQVVTSSTGTYSGSVPDSSQSPSDTRKDETSSRHESKPTELPSPKTLPKEFEKPEPIQELNRKLPWKRLLPFSLLSPVHRTIKLTDLSPELWGSHTSADNADSIVVAFAFALPLIIMILVVVIKFYIYKPLKDNGWCEFNIDKRKHQVSKVHPGTKRQFYLKHYRAPIMTEAPSYFQYPDYMIDIEGSRHCRFTARMAVPPKSESASKSTKFICRCCRKTTHSSKQQRSRPSRALSLGVPGLNYDKPASFSFNRKRDRHCANTRIKLEPLPRGDAFQDNLSEDERRKLGCFFPPLVAAVYEY